MNKKKLQFGFTLVNGANLYYELTGTGHPLLLVHAGLADCRMWDTQVGTFSEFFQTIRFDLRGFGRSSMPPGSFSNYEDVRGLLEFFDVERVSLLGISFGASIALDFTLAYPGSVKALILAAPSVSGTTPSERIRRFWQEEEEALSRGDFEGATELNLRLWVDGPYRKPGEVNSTVRERVREMQLNVFQKEIPDDIDEIGLNPPAIDRLGELSVPVQLMIGDKDLAEKHSLVEQLASEIGQSKKVVIPKAAHMLNMERPELFNQSVIQFLSSL
jgi:pimeloyl-ACP methyl ester carboxylesterase